MQRDSWTNHRTLCASSRTLCSAATAALVLTVALGARADVLCKRSNSRLSVRATACAKNETRVDPFLLASPAGSGGMADRVAELEARVAELETLLASASLQNGGLTLRFTGVNVQIVSGSGATDGPVNGLGN